MAAGQQDRYALAALILERLGPELEAEGYDLVDVRVFRGGGRQQVRLYVDLFGEARIDLDACAEASRSASILLEAADLFDSPWILEVSSPGIRPPLRREAHFLAAVGSDVQVKWRLIDAPMERPQSLRGRLVEVSGAQLTILPAGQETGTTADSAQPVIVPLAAVLEANLDQDFDAHEAIRRDRRQRKESKQATRGARRRRSAEASRRAAAISHTDHEGEAAGGDRQIENTDGATQGADKQAGGHRATDAGFTENERDERDRS